MYEKKKTETTGSKQARHRYTDDVTLLISYFAV